MSQYEPVATPIKEVETTQEKSRNIQPDSEVLDEGLDHSSYLGTYGSPFLADYLGIRDLYKSDPTGSVVSMVDEVTDHLLDESDGQPLVFVLKDMINRMEQEMNLKDNDAGLYRLKKIHKMMTIKKNLANIEKMKRQALDDINSMV